MRACCTWALLALWLFAGAARAGAQQGEPEFVLVRLRVTSVAGASAYVDAGRDDGLEPGDRVRFLRPGAAAVTGEVRSVSSRTARVQLFDANTVDVGFEGEARIPSARLAPKTNAAESEGPPDGVPHPPWTHEPVEWEEGVPLLAPATAREPKERELEVRGRAFLQLEPTWDDARDSESLFARLGTDLAVENPFARGGTLVFEGDLALRQQDVFGGEDRSDERLRLRRLSYAFGGTRYDPLRVEAGRFFQRSMPEFGLLDGAEVAMYRDPTSYVGVSAGYFVAPDFELTTGEDLQLAAFAGGQLTGLADLGWRAGYQKTWHEGDADRDLFAGGLQWFGEGGGSFVGSAMLDLYTSDELQQDSGIELSELHLDGGWRGDAIGVSAGVHRFRLPDLRRDPVFVPPGEDVPTPRSDSAYVRVQGDVSRNVRLSARLDAWETGTDHGGGGELRGDLRDLWPGGGVNATLYRTDGQLVDVDGLRCGVDQATSVGSWWAGYELSNVSLADAQGAEERQTRHSLRLRWDRTLGRDWSLSVYGEDHFGDDQDALVLGLYLQRRF